MKKLILIFLMALPVQAQPHKFWDSKNIVLHGYNFAGLSLDAITTQRVLGQGGRELNPLARPFVNRGWAGQAPLTYGIGFGGSILGSYILHKKGHHRLERWLPFVSGTGGFVAGGLNLRLR